MLVSEELTSFSQFTIGGETTNNNPPAIPANFTAIAKEDYIKLTWKPNSETDLKNYKLFRGTDKNKLSLLATVDKSKSSYKDQDVKANTTYYYGIKAVDNSGLASRMSKIVSAKLNINPPATPSNFILKTGGSNLVLQWSANTEKDLAGYIIYSGINPFNLTVLDSLAVNKTSYSINKNKSAYYALSAYDKDGYESSQTPFVSYVHQQLEITDEWKLVSIPGAGSYHVSKANVFTFEGSYKEANELKAGAGYWVKSYSPQTITIQNDGITKLQINLEKGWNMVGGLVDTLAASAIEDPNGILGTAPIYGFDLKTKGYKKTNQLIPQKDTGYIQNRKEVLS